MHLHQTSSPRAAATLPTEELRAEFLVSGLFPADGGSFCYWETDRTVLGGIVPAAVISIGKNRGRRSAAISVPL